MIHLFEGNTANDVWKEAFSVFYDTDKASKQPGRDGDTKELLHTMFSISDPRQRWVVLRDPPINPAFAIAEMVWIVTGRKDASFLTFWNTQLSRFMGCTEYYHGAYGFRLRYHFGIDQIDRAYSALLNNPDGRQVVLQLWDAAKDFPDKYGQPVAQDIPCNVLSLLKLRDNKLEWMQILRSNDLFLGVPYNFIQFTSIQEILAGWLGVDVGSYNHLSDSLHLYTRDISHMGIYPITHQRNTDSLALPKDDSDYVFKILNKYLENLISPNLEKKELMNHIKYQDLPEAYHNLLIILAAESARRRKWIDSSLEISSYCTNPMLKQVWNRWYTRLVEIQ